MNVIEGTTDRPGEFAQTQRVRMHTFSTDASVASGGQDAAPSPHDYFDASVGACKAITAMWYAKRHGIPLERVDTRVESDDTDERRGVYRLRVHVTFHGALSDEQRAALTRAAEMCPISKLMTTSDVQLETLVT
jgi:putative redox protein